MKRLDRVELRSLPCRINSNTPTADHRRQQNREQQITVDHLNTPDAAGGRGQGRPQAADQAQRHRFGQELHQDVLRTRPSAMRNPIPVRSVTESAVFMMPMPPKQGHPATLAIRSSCGSSAQRARQLLERDLLRRLPRPWVDAFAAPATVCHEVVGGRFGNVMALRRSSMV
jgi:hypothetical protein